MKTGLEGKYIIKDNKKMRFGYTTGSCAAAAAKAAAWMLFSGKTVTEVGLTTPKGIRLHLEVLETVCQPEQSSCAVQKDAGDDPDVTDGIRIFASAKKCSRREAQVLINVFTQPERQDKSSEAIPKENGISMTDQLEQHDEPDTALVGITKGDGIGTVTLPGLEQPVGAPAINRVPRAMITEEVQAVCREFGYSEGMEIRIWAPGGDKIAKKTFNPRLGIQGGISILGTSGIVEPMSEQALVASIELEMRQKSAGDRKYLLVTPGNYGTSYLKDNFPFEPEEAVKCSNYVGQTIDLAVNMGLSGLLFVAHIGKFVKVAGGIMNTHSREADARMEILASCALRAGADAKTARLILDSVTTDEGLRVLQESGVWEETLHILMEKIDFYLEHRSQGRLQTGVILFSNVFGELGRTKNVGELLKKLIEEKSHLR